MGRRRVTIVLGLVLAVVGAVPPRAAPASAAITFSDVPVNASYAADVRWMADRGIDRGSADGTFRPTAAVTRQAMAVFLYELSHRGTKVPGCTKAPFRGVPVSSSSCGAIAWTSRSGTQPGASTLAFSPTAAVNRGTLTAWLHRIAPPKTALPTCRTSRFTDVATTSGACGAIAWAYGQRVVVGATSTTFAPSAAVTRRVAATALHRFADVLHPVLGADVSYPQCASAGSATAGALPTGQAFGVVGVNKGLPTTTNPCLAAELAWAGRSTGGSAQPKVQLFVNTANPGGLDTASWPRSGSSAKYGKCTGTNSTACAYLYGQARAREDTKVAAITSPQSYTWWLDVEVASTWDTSSGGTVRNVAVLEGMVDHLRSIKVAGVGLYSSASHWRAIAGTSVSADCVLYTLPSWLAGASDLGGARRNCALPPLTAGGRVVLTQYTDTFDRDHSCV